MAKKKLVATSIDSTEQAEGVLAEIAAIDRKLTQVEVTMQEEIAAAKQKAAESKLAFEKRRKALADAVKKYATMNKPVLFEKHKSIQLAFGSFGFQASSGVQQMNGVSAEETIEHIKKFKFPEGIRIVEELDKEAVAKWPDERLALVGLRRVDKDTFWLKVNQEKLSAV
ncbi:host-nuclease inhibitor Gam family protein [Desulfovibrio cuneatus]|uniref:host-nuclease inhibitor Gam family protein n=1 Tax=Desulfovibrio cuneatus TaxID=159728 RepID=UPI000414FA4D|nr:host-nuclease inhibitor Gam family protein [Desulfovibrio cuneatus]